MIYGIGTDIVKTQRLLAMWERHGDKAKARLLASGEYAAFASSPDKGRFLAKRFAAKEALGKALGTGIRSPVLLTSIGVDHDDLGKPVFRYAAPLSDFMESRHLKAQLSLSDEDDYAIAFVIVEQA